MRLPITDEILINIYNTIDKIQEADIFPHSFKEAGSDYKWIRKMYESRGRRRNFYRFFNYLKKKGYIKVEKLESKKAILLTSKGKDRVLLKKLKSLEEKFKTRKFKKRKDGKWLMITFDVPEDKRLWRDIFRDGLISLGYIFFQKSIWISPFDNLEETEKLIQQSGLESFARIFLVEEIVS